MTQAIENVLRGLDERVEQMLSACTQCGLCVEACPMPEHVEIDVSKPKQVIAGIFDVLRDNNTDGNNAGLSQSEKWAQICTGSGYCIEACPEAINPRFLLAMTRRKILKRTQTNTRRAAGRAQFKKMSRGVRILSRLQLPTEAIERLSPSSHPNSHLAPELVFYTGCNLLKTPHIGLLCLDILDRLKVQYEVHGGPSSCCGILQMRAGDDENAMRQGTRTLQGFAQTKTTDVVSWCPTCHIQFNETTLPVQQQGTAPGFDMTMFPVYLASRLHELRPHLKNHVNKRVALHEHPGTKGVTEAVIALLSAVPGVQVVDLEQPRLGYTLNSLSVVPKTQKKLLANEFSAAEAMGIDALVGVYHSDHRELAGHNGQWSFEFINYMEIIGESMGCTREDIFKRLKTMQNVDAIIADSQELLSQHNIDLEQAREVIVGDMLGEQVLPIERSKHAAYLDAD